MTNDIPKCFIIKVLPDKAISYFHEPVEIFDDRNKLNPFYHRLASRSRATNPYYRLVSFQAVEPATIGLYPSVFFISGQGITVPKKTCSRDLSGSRVHKLA